MEKNLKKGAAALYNLVTHYLKITDCLWLMQKANQNQKQLLLIKAFAQYYTDHCFFLEHEPDMFVFLLSLLFFPLIIQSIDSSILLHPLENGCH